MATVGSVSDVTTALAKSKVAWLLLPPDSTVPCWYAGVGETAYIVGGEGEQPLPRLPENLRIILRDKETRAAIGPVPARATRVEPGSEEWDTATTALLATRQNTPAGDRRAFWAEHATVWAVDLSAGHADPQQPEDRSPH